jgi:hypothetical protein
MQIKSSSTKQIHTTQLLFALRDLNEHNSQGYSFHFTVNNIILRKLSFRLFLICIQTSFSAHHHESIPMWERMGIVEKGKVEKSHIIIVGMFRNQIIILGTSSWINLDVGGKCGNVESGKKPHNHRWNVSESNYHSTSRWLEEFFWEITEEVGMMVTESKQWINTDFVSCKLIKLLLCLLIWVSWL